MVVYFQYTALFLIFLSPVYSLYISKFQPTGLSQTMSKGLLKPCQLRTSSDRKNRSIILSSAGPANHRSERNSGFYDSNKCSKRWIAKRKYRFAAQALIPRGGKPNSLADLGENPDTDELKYIRKWRRREVMRIIRFALPALSITLADPLMSFVDAICIGRGGTTLQVSSASQDVPSTRIGFTDYDSVARRPCKKPAHPTLPPSLSPSLPCCLPVSLSPSLLSRFLLPSLPLPHSLTASSIFPAPTLTLSLPHFLPTYMARLESGWSPAGPPSWAAKAAITRRSRNNRHGRNGRNGRNGCNDRNVRSWRRWAPTWSSSTS